MAGGTISRTPHFVLHRGPLDAKSPLPGSAGPGAEPRAKALFAVQDEPWMGAVVPKRWARRAVTRNGIKRQIYNVSLAFEDRLSPAAHVVRLRTDFARKEFPSAWSEALKGVVRAELEALFEQASAKEVPGVGSRLRGNDRSVVPAKAGTQACSAARGPLDPCGACPRVGGGRDDEPSSVTPAKAGAQGALDSRLRGNDESSSVVPAQAGTHPHPGSIGGHK